MEKKEKPRSRVIVDANKHGIRRERNIDYVKKKFEDELNPKINKKDQK